MTFTEEEIIEIESKCSKDFLLAKLYAFWKDASEDGYVAAKIAINRKWLDISRALQSTPINIEGDDKVFESFLKTTKLFEDIDKAKHKVEVEKAISKGKGKHDGKAMI